MKDLRDVKDLSALDYNESSNRYVNNSQSKSDKKDYRSQYDIRLQKDTRSQKDIRSQKDTSHKKIQGHKKILGHKINYKKIRRNMTIKDHNMIINPNIVGQSTR